MSWDFPCWANQVLDCLFYRVFGVSVDVVLADDLLASRDPLHQKGGGRAREGKKEKSRKNAAWWTCPIDGEAALAVSE